MFFAKRMEHSAKRLESLMGDNTFYNTDKYHPVLKMTTPINTHILNAHPGQKCW